MVPKVWQDDYRYTYKRPDENVKILLGVSVRVRTCRQLSDDPRYLNKQR